MLFHNDHPDKYSGSITLKETAANFDMISLFYTSNDSVYSSVDVYKPKGKTASLFCYGIATHISDYPVYLKFKTVKIQDNIVNTYYDPDDAFDYWTGQQRIGNVADPKFINNDYIKITTVIGYKGIQ